MTSSTPPECNSTASPGNAVSTHRLGLPWYGIAALVLIAVPRVVLHDLHIIAEGTAINSLFVFVPPLIWIITVLVLRTPRPFLALLSVGAVYGVVLAALHVLLWDANLGAAGAQLGGNLATLPDWAHDLILKSATAITGILTGLAVGALTGLIAAGLRRLGQLTHRYRR